MSSSTETILPVLSRSSTDAALSLEETSLDTAPHFRHQVHLPPSTDSNFVIHYRSTDFHVHTLVLRTHSTYFRTYLSALQPLKEVHVEEVVEEGRKRRKVTAYTSLEPCAKCDASSLTQCIDLPDSFGLAAATEAEFLLFLRHLYFSSILHLPPFNPKERILSVITAATPVCLSFPPTSPTQTEISSYANAVEGSLGWSRAVLSLFHYFDCVEALKRCDAVISGHVQQQSQVANHFRTTWDFLPVAVSHGLQKPEAACFARVGKDHQVRVTDPEYAQLLARLTPAMLGRVIEAFSGHAKREVEPVDTSKSISLHEDDGEFFL